MKPLHLLRVAAAFTLLSACNLLSNPDTPHVVSLPTPPHKADANKYVAVSPKAPFKSIELTESGKFIVLQTSNPRHPETPEEATHAGNFTGSSGHYNLEGFGTLDIVNTRADFKLTVTLSDGTKVEFEADSVGTPLSGTFADNLCRTWVPKQTLIQVMGGDAPTSLGVGRIFDGCDLPAMASYINDNGIRITESFEGYKVTSVTLSAAKTIMITFEGQNPYVGEWEPNLENGDFSYEFEAGDGNSLINGSGRGNVSFNSSDDLKLILEAVIKSGSKTYAAKSTVTMAAAK